MSTALQSKFSIKNKQGSVLCNNFKHQKLNHFSKVVFIIYNTDDYYQLLKINNKTQLSLNEIPFELKIFVNKSCQTEEPIFKITKKDMIDNKLDYKLLEKKILDFLYKNKLSQNIEKINYYINLINLYLEQDREIEINNILNGHSFTIENKYLRTNLDSNIDLTGYEYVNIYLTRNDNHALTSPTYIPGIPNVILNLDNNPNQKYLYKCKFERVEKSNNILKIYFNQPILDIIRAFYYNNFKIEVVNYNINKDYILKLFDFICYLNREPTNYFDDITKLVNISKKNIFLSTILKKIPNEDEFLNAFSFYKKIELEKYNYTVNEISHMLYLKSNIFFTNLIPGLLNDLRNINPNKEKYITTTKLYTLYQNRKEINNLINEMDNLNLEYQSMFALNIFTFFEVN